MMKKPGIDFGAAKFIRKPQFLFIGIIIVVASLTAVLNNRTSLKSSICKEEINLSEVVQKLNNNQTAIDIVKKNCGRLSGSFTADLTKNGTGEDLVFWFAGAGCGSCHTQQLYVVSNSKAIFYKVVQDPQVNTGYTDVIGGKLERTLVITEPTGPGVGTCCPTEGLSTSYLWSKNDNAFKIYDKKTISYNKPETTPTASPLPSSSPKTPSDRATKDATWFYYSAANLDPKDFTAFKSNFSNGTNSDSTAIYNLALWLDANPTNFNLIEKLMTMNRNDQTQQFKEACAYMPGLWPFNAGFSCIFYKSSAPNSSSNQNQSAYSSPSPTPTPPPSFWYISVDASPSPQKVGSSINITASAVSPIKACSGTIRLPSGNSQPISSMTINGSTCSGSITVSESGGVLIYVTATSIYDQTATGTGTDVFVNP